MIRVGQRLRDERVRRGLTIEEVSQATKIRPEFISAIERGNYKKLPSSAYIYGFVKNYISYLGLPSRELLALFRREFDEREYIGVLPESFTKKKDMPMKRFNIFRIVVLSILVLMPLVLYTLFQYRSAIFDPTLIIISPRENETVQALSVTVVGKTDPNVTVTVNDIPVIVDNSGNFKKLLNVFSTDTKITIKAANSFGRISIVNRDIKVKPKE